MHAKRQVAATMGTPMLGSVLRAYRERALLSQEELAERAGLSARTVREIEAGRVRRPHGQSLRLLADALGLDDQQRAALAEIRSDAAGTAVTDRMARTLSSGAGAVRQLPMDVADFTGRCESLLELDGLLPVDDAAVPAAVMITAIAGTAGVGKTALAVHWAHRVAGRFPDGQLFVNLDGYALGPPLRPIQALTRLLHALGVAADAVPVEVEDAAALYRSLLADRRMLVVLDNARSADQIRLLLPGSSGSLVVVTSRDRLAGLVATHGAHQLTLHVLTETEANALLTRILGHDRVNAEPKATAELAEVCAYVPLALRIAAANLVNLAGVPARPIAEYVTRLRGGDRLAELVVHGDRHTAVRAAFDSSYTVLNSDAQRLFRLLGLVPGSDITPPAAAALADIPPDQARQLLERLAAAHLVEPRPPGRFGLHDLLRSYAHQRSLQVDSEPERQHAVTRLLDWYLHAADEADRLLYPERLRLPVPRTAASPPPGFTGHADALTWLDAERANLVAAVEHAAETGPQPIAWLLADALHMWFWSNRHTVDWLTVASAGLAAANTAGDPKAQAAAQHGVGMVYHCLGDNFEAVQRHTKALLLAREAGWVEGEAATLTTFGIVRGELGQLHEAADCYAQSLTLNRRTGHKTGQATALNNLADIYRQLGRPAQAVGHLTQALILHREVSSDSGQATTLATLGEVYRDLGRFDDAHTCVTQALALVRELGKHYGEAADLSILATVHRDAGRLAPALKAANDALKLAREVVSPPVEAGALNVLGDIHLILDSDQDAVKHHQQALDLARGTHARYPEIEALLGLAAAHHRQRQHDCAINDTRQALNLACEAGYQILEGHAHVMLAAIHLARGHHDNAVKHARHALAIHQETGHRLGYARALIALGDIARAMEDSTAAAVRWQEALMVFTDIGHPDANDLRALLAGDQTAANG
jgi:tetratricopeptide (TPR) repeat protein